jgi:IS66 C-terminal element/Uncharacterised protein family (UPF0149)
MSLEGPCRPSTRIEIAPAYVDVAVKRWALNRKNALFAAHDAGAENWVCLASLIETCKLNGIDPQAYLADVLTRLVSLWPAARIDELLPWAWTGARQRRRAGRVTDAFAYAELDEILRGAGRTGAIGMSAIEGLIAALVAAPSFVHPEEWIPLIFGGRQPLHENSPELRAVKTIFNRYNEVSETDWPPAYRPIFMVDDDGSIIAHDWTVGFAQETPRRREMDSNPRSLSQRVAFSGSHHPEFVDDHPSSFQIGEHSIRLQRIT